MHTDLSPHLHTEKCNALINQLKECHENNIFLKFFGYCNSEDKLVIACLKEERLQRREANYRKSLERKTRLWANLSEQSQKEHKTV